MERSKEEFLRRFGDDYGYPNAPKTIDEIRATEFKRLDGLVYLDHAGATLYSEAQMEAVAKDLVSNVYGNPHSQSDSSMATLDNIAAARQQVLDYFNASPMEYKCIFTSGATAALKLVGEAFPWKEESCYMYTMENHNSVLGIREYALEKGATVCAIDIKELEEQTGKSNAHESSIQISKRSVQKRVKAKPPQESLQGSAYNLFAFPSECNFSGLKFRLDLVNMIKEDAGIFETSLHGRGKWMVLIDAAKGCATEPPDLARHPADFVVFSFYKIFGYPTGLGALVVRTEAAKLLKKAYFSGGTVSASISDIDYVKRREGIEQLFEDGTLSFLSITSIRHGFSIMNTLTSSAIARHTACLATYVRNKMLDLKHQNGFNVCTLYGEGPDGEGPAKVIPLKLGPTVAFNLRRVDGSWIGYREIDKLASLSGIQLRTGCFCNPGACAKYLGLSHSDLLSNIEAGHVCWDDHDILCGKPTGAVRISFGYMSSFEDAENFLEFLIHSFVEIPYHLGNGISSPTKVAPLSDIGGRHLSKCVSLKSLTIYPVKSCAGFNVQCWPLSTTGLLYDREWLLKGPNGDILTQKKVQVMCQVYTFIDLKKGEMYLESPNCKEKLQISLHADSRWSSAEEMDIYGQRYEVWSYDREVNAWFTEAIAHPCTLVRCLMSKERDCIKRGQRYGFCRDLRGKLNFVNEAQMLLVSEESVSDLNARLASRIPMVNSGTGEPVLVDPMRFRPNLVVAGAEPYAEDNWTGLRIGKAHFISLGGCNRCQMINLNQQVGEKMKLKEPLATLASYRRDKGKILFGILLRYEGRACEDEEDLDEETWLQVGEIFPSMK